MDVWQTFQNARDFVSAGAIPHLFTILRTHVVDPAVVSAVFTGLRHLACDDKICVVRRAHGVGAGLVRAAACARPCLRRWPLRMLCWNGWGGVASLCVVWYCMA